MDILRLFQQAARDRFRGATEIERDLLIGLSERFRGKAPGSEALRLGAGLLRESQPCMANLRRLAMLLESRMPAAELFRILQARLEVLLRLGSLLGAQASASILGAVDLLTISRSSAVFAAINASIQKGWSGRVFVLDGSPSGRGKEQAERLRKLDLEVISLPDAAMLEAFDEASASLLVLSGADAVGSRRVVNSQGTHLLMEVAGSRRVRRVLVADSGKDLPEEEIDEVLQRSPKAEEGQGRSWPVFEALPLELFDSRVREDATIHLKFPRGP